MTAPHLSQGELARRLRVSPRTLEGWRWRGTGPRFVKAGGRVLYRLEDVEAFEAEQLRQRTPVAADPGRVPSTGRMAAMDSISLEHVPVRSASAKYSWVLLFSLSFVKANICLSKALFF